MNVFINKKITWLNLAMVILTFLVVIFRYVFGLSWVWLQELVLYIHATVFMSAAGFSLAKDEHVKVDILYAKMSERKKAFINIGGVFFFLFPFCVLMLIQSFPYVLQSWKVFEKSGDANGLPAVFLLKTLLFVYPCLLFFQGVLLFLDSCKKIRGENV